MKTKTTMPMLPALLLALAAQAQPQVKVEQAWVRATVAQQKATGAFFRLQSAADARLVEVKTPLAELVEIHEMAMDGDTMKMRPVASLELPAGKPVELKPGGYHLMLMALKKPIAAGEQLPLTLVFEDRDKKRQTVEIKAEARQLGAPAAAHQH
ncbi:copper chaperone PCu(A)C [Roseateles violae]|uniref:Copper chaperone PCu(A)C n=1 Tax=Roseateles violae TaxID=3058042 RepID=A0ABT8DX96_9BURK|nr:copper chaperone PCu(A)C [Pelomonas sp. PFR6]MDN3921945.1 copper chaperone PCu(A)C [Pelomonas sp. PFR6]